MPLRLQGERVEAVISSPTNRLAVVYIRVSTEDQAREGVSLAVQRSTCRGWADERGWEVTDEFEDIDSGLRVGRKGYQAMLARVRALVAAGQRVAVVAASLDRLGRGLAESMRCREELAGLGVLVGCVREGGELPDLVATILAVVAQEESQRTGARIRSAKRHLQAQGWHVSTGAPWGYRWRDATPDERAAGAPRHVLDEHPVTAPALREVFQRTAEGARVQDTARWLATLPTDVRGGHGLRGSALIRILRSPTYVGRRPVPFTGRRAEMLDGPHDPPVRWPALVSHDLWERAQDVLDAVRADHSSGRFLLTGLLRCPRCGGGAAGAVGTKRLSPYYVCAHCPSGRPCTRRIGVSAPIDAAVVAQVRAVIAMVATPSPGAACSFEGRWRALTDRRTSRISARAIGKREQRARQRLVAAERLLISGDLVQGGYELVVQRTQEELAALRAEQMHAPDLRTDLPSFSRLGRLARQWVKDLDQADLPSCRKLLRHLIEGVSVHHVRRATFEVEVHWTHIGRAIRAAGARDGEAPS